MKTSKRASLRRAQAAELRWLKWSKQRPSSGMMATMPPRARRWRSTGRTVGLVVAAVLAAVGSPFYLFVVPTMVAASPTDGASEYLGVGFAAFLFLQVWLLIAMWALQSLSGLYGVRFGWLERWTSALMRSDPPKRVRRIQAVITGLLSFLLTTYAFGVAYLFISTRDPGAFATGRLDVPSAFYYGFATAVTYGDLGPQTWVAKGLVIAQLFLTLIYSLFLLSSLAGALQPPFDSQD